MAMMSLEKITNLRILCLVGALWCLAQLFTHTSAGGDHGYLIFVAIKMGLPVCLALLLYSLELFKTRGMPSRTHRLSIHVPYAIMLFVIVHEGAGYCSWYQAMDDAPRGLLWDIYDVESLIVGVAIRWTSRGVVYLSRRRRWR